MHGMPCRSPVPLPAFHRTFSAWMSRSESPRRGPPKRQEAPTRLTVDERVGSRKAPRLRSVRSVKIRIGYEITYDCPQPTPMLLVLRVHPSRHADLLTPDPIGFDPPIPSTDYRDGFGNICT